MCPDCAHTGRPARSEDATRTRKQYIASVMRQWKATHVPERRVDGANVRWNAETDAFDRCPTFTSCVTDGSPTGTCGVLAGPGCWSTTGLLGCDAIVFSNSRLRWLSATPLQTACAVV
jgi:hypothetical protein